MDKIKNHYQTYELPLAATLCCLGFSVCGFEKEHNSGKYVFIFERPHNIDEIIAQYYSDTIQVAPRAFNNALRDLKSIIYSGSL